jgi:hypothetical protein
MGDWLAPGSTCVTRYHYLGDPTIAAADLDLYYTRAGSAMTAKADANDLAAADFVNAPWEANHAFHVGLGWFRVDWPDTAFAAGARQVFLHVKYGADASDVATLQIDLDTDMEVIAQTLGGRVDIDRSVTPNEITIYKADNVTPLRVLYLSTAASVDYQTPVAP